MATLVSLLLSTLVGTWVGIRLLRTAARTRQFAESAIGLGLLSHAAVTQPVLLGMSVLGGGERKAIVAALPVVLTVSTGLTHLGFCLFTWRVFGAGRRWRGALCIGLIAVMMFRDSTMGDNLPAKLAIVTVVGFINAVTWGLTFAPPQSYLAYVRRRAEVKYG